MGAIKCAQNGCGNISVDLWFVWGAEKVCGIAVYKSDEGEIESIEAGVMHRGRDGHKISMRDGIVFSHYLHSTDGKHVAQPFEGEGVLTANCEIYNWRELAEKYGVGGRNDAEVLFGLLEQCTCAREIWEIRSQFDGDFACAYYRNGNLYAFRDQFGVNPLFYSAGMNGTMVIASERKAFRGLRELHPRSVLVADTETCSAETRYWGWALDAVGAGLASAEEFAGIADVEKAVIEAIRKRIAEVKFGVLFSGGIDSALIAMGLREAGADAKLYVAGAAGSEDVLIAEKFADEYGFVLGIADFCEEDVEREVPRICRAIDSCDSVKVGVAVPIHFASMLAGRENVKVAYSGLGADDLFAGYKRFKDGDAGTVKNLYGEVASSLRSIYERDLYRDNTIAMHNGIELRVPFLDRELLRAVLSSGGIGYGKGALREILRNRFGVNDGFCGRPKRAAQYGSLSMKMLRKIATKNMDFNGNSGAPQRGINGYLYSRHEIKNMHIGVLYTGGKDSAYAAYLMKMRNYGLACLISVFSENPYSYMFHTPRISEVEAHSAKMKVPLVKVLTGGEKEIELADLERALRMARDEHKIEGVATGAICSEYQRDRIELVCERVGLRVFSPLWHTGQEMHMRRLVRDGFRFIMTSVAAEGLGKEWIGKEIGNKEIDELVRISKKTGINIAGEGGEFETLVVKCPLFGENR